MRLPLALLALVALAPTAAACDGLSPGDHIVSNGASCTLGFLLASKDGLYFSTAGHCVTEGSPVTSDGVGDIGVAVLRHLVPDTGQATDGEPGEDFGLIRIHPAIYAKLNPRMCAWGGPTGLVTDASADGGGVRHHGYGILLGDTGATRAREGFLLTTDGTYAFYWKGAGVPGDSGSAVIAADGRALGVLTHLQIGTSGDTNGGTHLSRGFEIARERGFGDMRLVLEGEDPVAVLAEMQGPSAPPQTADPQPTPPEPPTTKPTSQPARPTPTTGNSTAPANGTSGNDSVSPAGGHRVEGAVADDAAGGNKTPGAPLAVALAALAGAALARRARR